MADMRKDSGDVGRGEVRDRRFSPRGVLPRRVQTWIMVGLALVIVAVIVLTGHKTPPATSLEPADAQPAPAQPERIRTFQREMTARPPIAESAAAISADSAAEIIAPQAVGAAAGQVAVSDTDERRRREYQSLFADNVAFSRRAGSAGSAPSPVAPAPMLPSFPLPTPADLAAFQQSLSGIPRAAAPAAAPTVQVEPIALPPERQASLQQEPTAGKLRVQEGTFIEAVLLNRLDGTFAGPVTCLVTTPVYSEDRQHVLVPAGARIVGDAAPVQTWGDSRLAVTFHRLLLPNGATVSLEQFRGLNQVGETGLKDAVNRHYLQVFGASVAIGALSGLAQWDARGGYNGSASDGFRQSAGSSLAASTGRVLERYLNVLPTITIREGHRIKVYLTNDLFLPAFAVTRDDGIPTGGL